MYTDDERKHTTKRERTASFLRKEVFQDVVINVKDSELAKFKSVKVYNNDYVRSQNFNIYAEQSHPYNFPEYTPETRNLFVKCVLLMVLTMFMFSGILVLYVMITPDVRNFLSEYVLNSLFISLSVFLFVDYAFVCAECARIGPCNFVCLTLTVLSLSTALATISAALKTDILLYAILATTVTVLVGVFLSCTKFDFKSHMLYVVLLGTSFGAIVVIVLTIVLVNKIFVDVLWLIILLIVTFIQVVLLTMQLQQILRGASVEFKEDDYALASFMLYASVIDIFIKLCQIAGITRDMSDRR